MTVPRGDVLRYRFDRVYDITMQKWPRYGVLQRYECASVLLLCHVCAKYTRGICLRSVPRGDTRFSLTFGRRIFSPSSSFISAPCTYKNVIIDFRIPVHAPTTKTYYYYLFYFLSAVLYLLCAECNSFAQSQGRCEWKKWKKKKHSIQYWRL